MAKQFPYSTCVECGKKMESGQLRRCEVGSYCSWYVPRAVTDFIADPEGWLSRNRSNESV